MQKGEIEHGRLLVLFLILCFPILGFSQVYNFKNYNIDHRFPATQPNKFYQDNKGFIWICTDGEGLIHFDGVNFKTFEASDSVLNNQVKTVVQDRDGLFWIGTEDGLTTFDGTHFKKIMPSLFNKVSIRDILVDKKGSLWIATFGKGLFQYKNKVFKQYSARDGLNKDKIISVVQDQNNNIWLGTPASGIIRFDGVEFKSYSTANGLPNDNVSRLLADNNGSVWIGTRQGLSKFANGKFSNYGPKEGLTNTYVTDISMDKLNNLWIGTLGGIYKFNNTYFKNYNSSNGLSSNFINTLASDSEGNLWIGTDLPSVTMLSVHQICYFTEKNGLNSNSVLGITSDIDGKIWFATSKGLNVFDGGVLKSIDDIAANPSSSLFLFRNDTIGNVWLGRNNRISRFDSKKSKVSNTNQTSPPFFSINKVAAILGDHSFDSLNGPNSLGGAIDANEFEWIVSDTYGQNWIITKREGLVVLDKNLERINVVLDEKISKKDVNAIAVDNDGSIWIAAKSGVMKMKFGNGSYHQDIVLDNICKNVIRSMIFDNQGHLWMGTDGGIYSLDLPEFTHSNKRIITRFGKDEGFISVECNPHATFKDKEGFIWFGTQRGAVKLYPATEEAFKNSLHVYISNIKLFYEDVNWKKYSKKIKPYFNIPIDLRLPHNNNYLTFEFVGLHFSNPNKVKYQFKLLPNDEEWLPLTYKNDATYSNLDPGTYQFEVRATVNGMWWSKPAAFTFSISKPFWKTWWFFALLVISTAGLIYLYISNHTHSLKAIQKDLEVKVHQRTSQLEEQKNKLQEAYKIIEEKNSEITDSIRYAKNIQEAILPPLHLLKNFLPDSFVFFMPKDIVSGDFYWLAQTETKVVVAAVDCTGHGVPGAFMSFVGYNLLNQIVNQSKITNPADILNNLNISLNESLRNTLGTSDIRDGMDIAVCTIDVELQVAEYAGAYNPLYHIRNKQLTIFPADRFPVGSYMEMSHKKFAHHKIDLLPGDTIYIFTDGYSDQFGGSEDKKFMYSRFRNLLINVQDLNMTEQKLVLYKEFHNWKGINEQVDDVLVIGIRI